MDDDSVKDILPALRVISFLPFLLFFGSLLYFLFAGSEDNISHNSAVTGYHLTGSGHERLSARKIGGFRITAYCSGKCCNGRWHGQTALGRSMSYYMKKKIKIAAVDPEIIPLGTWLKYGAKYYLAADTGSYIKGRRVDLLLNDHGSTVEFGIKHDQTIEVIADERVMSRLLRFFYEPGIFEISYLADHPFVYRGIKENVH